MRAMMILAFVAAATGGAVSAMPAPTAPAAVEPGQYNPCNPKLRKCD